MFFRSVLGYDVQHLYKNSMFLVVIIIVIVIINIIISITELHF